MIDKIPLSLTTNYVKDWDIPKATTEILQNALDQEHWNTEYEERESVLTITSFGGTIPLKHLLMGSGSKSDDHKKRGGFSEGLKIALCVFMREGIDVQIFNGDFLWTPVLEYNPSFETDHLHIKVEENPFPEDDVVKVVLKGITQEDWEIITNNTLHLQDDLGEVHITSKGRVLVDERFKGRVYCGGLFVTSSNVSHGFDFKPEHLPLDRDRKNVRSFDLQWQTQQMWSEVVKKEGDDVVEYVASKLEEGKSNDMQYMSCTDNVGSPLKEKCFEKFVEKHGEKAIIAKDYEESQALKSSGYTNVVFTGNEAFAKIVQQSEGYQTLNHEVQVKTIPEILSEWGDEWSSGLTLEARQSFDKLIDTIEGML